MIKGENLVKIYQKSGLEVMALRGVDLTIEAGELMAIIGSSGSGKSTLLNILGGLDQPTAGELTVAGNQLLEMTEEEMVEYRQNTVGFVWQNNARNLIPYLTARENVELPMLISSKQAATEPEELLELVGLSHRVDNKLHELSGGEQQRVAIAIALANQPEVLLADEPTGAVDTETGDRVLTALQNLNQELGVTIVIVTHDQRLSNKVERIVALEDGVISTEFVQDQKYKREMDKLAAEEENFAFHEQLAVVDKVGRLQLSGEYLQKAGLAKDSKAKLEIKEEGLLVKPKK